MKNNPKSKKGRILRHLQGGRTITQWQALSLYGSMRLASTINRLRNEGFKIDMNMRTGIHGDIYGEYKLIAEKVDNVNF